MKTKEESNKNIKTSINGIKLNDSNLDYHINCLISEIKECNTNKILKLIKEIFYIDGFDFPVASVDKVLELERHLTEGSSPGVKK